VEETEEEISEMYDDFPSEFTAPVNIYAPGLYADVIESVPDEWTDDFSSNFKNGSSRESIRHSGMDQLQEFLSLESNDSFSSKDISDIATTPQQEPGLPASSPFRPGAVNRLGHSSAIDQLQKLVRGRSDV
jgi:hypothetical protein